MKFHQLIFLNYYFFQKKIVKKKTFGACVVMWVSTQILFSLYHGTLAALTLIILFCRKILNFFNLKKRVKVSKTQKFVKKK
jgi:hypothetical protein